MNAGQRRVNTVDGGYPAKNAFAKQPAIDVNNEMHHEWTGDPLPEDSKRQVRSMALNRAARQVKVRHQTLRKLLANEGKIRPEKRKGSLVPVSYEDITRLAADYANSIPFSQLGPLLGIGYPSAKRIRDSGRLPIWIRGGRANEKWNYLFRRQEIEQWVDTLIGNVPENDKLPDGCIGLAEAPISQKVPMLVLIDAIEGGRVMIVGRLKGKPKFGGAILRKEEVKAVVPEEIRRALSQRRSGPRGPYRKREG